MVRLGGFRWLAVFLLLAASGALVATDADARSRGGGSRCARTYTAPPTTSTAPKTAAPIERSMTQPSRPSTVGAAPSAQPGGMFNRGGFMGGLFAGFLGAGLLGLLFGNGLLGGLGGLASFLGLILQVALIVLVAGFLLSWWQRRNAPAYAGPQPSMRDAQPEEIRPRASGSFAQAGAPVSIEERDYDDFERLLGEVQDAYGKEDLARLRQVATPEMVSYFAEDLGQNASRGVVNEISGVKLLQGDLAEAWREASTEYATVAMRYEISDAMIERNSGRVVEGAREPQEVTELWTFRRDRGGNWILSAIQQA